MRGYTEYFEHSFILTLSCSAVCCSRTHRQNCYLKGWPCLKPGQLIRGYNVLAYLTVLIHSPLFYSTVKRLAVPKIRYIRKMFHCVPQTVTLWSVAMKTITHWWTVCSTGLSLCSCHLTCSNSGCHQCLMNFTDLSVHMLAGFCRSSTLRTTLNQ